MVASNKNNKSRKLLKVTSVAVLVAVVVTTAFLFNVQNKKVHDKKVLQGLSRLAGTSFDCAKIMSSYGHEKPRNIDTKELLLRVKVLCSIKEKDAPEARKNLALLEKLYKENASIERNLDIKESFAVIERLEKQKGNSVKKSVNNDGVKDEDGSYAGP